MTVEIEPSCGDRRCPVKKLEAPATVVERIAGFP